MFLALLPHILLWSNVFEATLYIIEFEVLFVTKMRYITEFKQIFSVKLVYNWI